jgi:hypothetical protein
VVVGDDASDSGDVLGLDCGRHSQRPTFDVAKPGWKGRFELATFSCAHLRAGNVGDLALGDDLVGDVGEPSPWLERERRTCFEVDQRAEQFGVASARRTRLKIMLGRKHASSARQPRAAVFRVGNM